MNWTEYIYIAQKTIEENPTQEPDEEAKCRSAMSRAYYAAFCYAKTYLDAKGKTIKPRTIKRKDGSTGPEGSHEAVIRTLLDVAKNCNNKVKSKLKQLYYLKKLRKCSDYPDDLSGNWLPPPSRNEVICHINTCNKIIDTIKHLP
ncbi:MAG: hypothetical protein ABRQ39_09590 [Candidatus Eremiobacterota bacterium]